MKNFYRITTITMSIDGRRNGYRETFIHTTDPEAYVEAMRCEIEKLPQWWLYYARNYDDKRPEVYTQLIEVVEC